MKLQSPEFNLTSLCAISPTYWPILSSLFCNLVIFSIIFGFWLDSYSIDLGLFYWIRFYVNFWRLKYCLPLGNFLFSKILDWTFFICWVVSTEVVSGVGLLLTSLWLHFWSLEFFLFTQECIFLESQVSSNCYFRLGIPFFRFFFVFSVHLGNS